MSHPLSPVQKEIYDFIVEFYKQNDNLNPSLRDIANGQINGKQVINAQFQTAVSQTVNGVALSSTQAVVYLARPCAQTQTT